MTKPKTRPRYNGKHPGGRPPKFDDPAKLDAMIDEYMANCPDKRKVITKDGDTVEVPCYTITGLALYLGFCDRHSMHDYERRPEFSASIKRARAFIERHYEMLLQAGNGAGAIFALKNFGWRDKQEVEHSGGVTVEMPTVKVGDKKLEFDCGGEGPE